MSFASMTRKQRELDALASGVIVSNPIEDDSRLRIRSAVDDFLEEIRLSRQRKTWMGDRYQRCRRPEQISLEFDKLQDELECRCEALIRCRSWSRRGNRSSCIGG